MKDNIAKAIKMETRFMTPWKGGLRCFDSRMGYGQHIDLTTEEYEIYQKVAYLTIEEQLKRLDEYKEVQHER